MIRETNNIPKETHFGTLCVTAKYLAELKHLTSICEEYFGDYLTIIPCEEDKLEELTLLPDAFLTTAITKESVPTRFPNTKIFYCERDMTGQNLELLIMVPKNSQVLVVNSPRASAEDAVEKLNELELHGFKYIPYWPGCDVNVSDYKYAAYFGIPAYLPDGDYTAIDLGNRVISINVIIELVNYFHLPVKLAERYYRENIERIIGRAETISTMLRTTKQSLVNFEMACNMNQNIVFSIDINDKINLFNTASEKFFGISKERAIGTDYHSCLGAFKALIVLLEEGEEVEDSIVEYEGQNLVVSTTKYSADEKINTLVTIVSVPELQKSESQIRRRLRRNDFVAKYTFNSIKGKSPKILAAKEFAHICSQSDATILLTGESGTGKELFAQSIHNASPRAAEPFVGINFAALPETLAESELFGYEEGAFTGAVKGGKQGLFELAHGGTIFLDEIGDASLSMQTRLLRVLEEREVVRVGGNKIIPVNVRVICATNKDLKKMVQEGTFREDLYYRIKVLSLSIPSLRQRIDDVPVLLRSMLSERDVENFVTEDVLELLTKAEWPGNARELKAVAEYIKVLGTLKKKGKYADETLNEMLIDYLIENMEFSSGKSSDRLESAINKIEDFALDNEMILILKAIYNLKEKKISAGRGTLAKVPELIEAELTESKIKTRMTHLENQGYITVGKTKQGASLTENGLAVINK